MSELEVIKEVSGAKENECACKTCKSMCHRMSCIGTPDDIMLLVNNGYIGSVSPSRFLAGIAYGIPEIKMMQITFDHKNSKCVLLDDNDMCTIHSLGIKPTEGRLASHSANGRNQMLPIAYTVAPTWLLPTNLKTIEKLFNTYRKFIRK